MAWDDPITWKQVDYIEGLSEINPDGQKIIRIFLKKFNKNRVFELNKKEASRIINTLLCPVEYVFPCGAKSIIYKYEHTGTLISMHFSDTFENCLYYCPKGVKIGDCRHWKADDSWSEEEQWIFNNFQNAMQEACKISGDICEIGLYISEYLEKIDEKIEYYGSEDGVDIVKYENNLYFIDLYNRKIEKENR